MSEGGDEAGAQRGGGLKRTLVWGAVGVAAFLCNAASEARPNPAGALDGLWQNRKATLDVRIAPCGAGYCGTIVAARGEAVENARSGGATGLVGTRVLENFAAASDGVWHGSVFAPQLHRRLSSKLKFIDANRIELTTCLLGSFLCDTNTWHRIGA
jgi:uncharacterized protein (DUF2147 family)